MAAPLAHALDLPDADDSWTRPVAACGLSADAPGAHAVSSLFGIPPVTFIRGESRNPTMRAVR